MKFPRKLKKKLKLLLQKEILSRGGAFWRTDEMRLLHFCVTKHYKKLVHIGTKALTAYTLTPR